MDLLEIVRKYSKSIKNRNCKNCEDDKFIKQQSKVTFNDIHKSFTIYSS